MDYIVYILKCSDDTLYTGITNNLAKRLKIHSIGKGSKYVKARRPFVLVYTEKGYNKSEALKREYVIKKLSRKKKLNLIKDQ